MTILHYITLNITFVLHGRPTFHIISILHTQPNPHYLHFYMNTLYFDIYSPHYRYVV